MNLNKIDSIIFDEYVMKGINISLVDVEFDGKVVGKLSETLEIIDEQASSGNYRWAEGSFVVLGKQVSKKYEVNINKLILNSEK